MEVESRITATFDQERRERTDDSQPINQVSPTEQNRNYGQAVRENETRLDQAFAAIVCGLTASVVAFIFGLVTQYIQRTIDNLLLSTFVGLCMAVIAYALMTNEDK